LNCTLDIFIRNVGPIAELDVQQSFRPDGKPIPTVFVGANGSGKTNLLSVIADSLFEAAGESYSDLLAPAAGTGRHYFRLLGSVVRRHGSAYSVALLRYANGSDEYGFVEKTGAVADSVIVPMVRSELARWVSWQPEVDKKDFSIPRTAAQQIFESEAFCFFPSSRAERPAWLNTGALREDSFSTSPKFSGQLRKPLFVERGLDAFAQWMLALILDSRANVSRVPGPFGLPDTYLVEGNPGPFLEGATKTVAGATYVLREILADPSARFTWLGRNRAGQLAEHFRNAAPLRGLKSRRGNATSRRSWDLLGR
jgi:hypothetical protein